MDINSDCLYALITKQECIPVGCVPFAAVAVSRGGGSPWRGGLLGGGWGSPWQGGLLGGGSPLGVSLAGGGVSLAGDGGSPRQGGVPACTEADPPSGAGTPPVDRQTPVKT